MWMRKIRPVCRMTCLSPSVRTTALLSKRSPVVGALSLQRNVSETFEAKNKRLGRPTSPHMLIYKFELPGLLSGSHRATGFVQSGVISLAAIGLMCAPENLEYYVNYLHSLELPRAVWVSTKMLFAWPFMYHLLNGFRHLVWDVTAKGLNQSDMYRTGYLILISSFLLTGSLKRKSRLTGLESDPEDDLNDNTQPITLTLEKDVDTEATRVKRLLEKRSEIPRSQNNDEMKESSITVSKGFFTQLFGRLDGIQNTLEKILEKTSAESAPTRHHYSTYSTPPNKKTKHFDENVVIDKTSLKSSSPKVQEVSIDVEDYGENKEFDIGGINLLTDVPAKSKKPNLYATQLLSILFTDEELRNGCVEPKDANGKKEILSQEKINVIKKCLNIKYGERIQKNWSEIRQSLNQKCLDKKKQYLKRNQLEKKKEDMNDCDQDNDFEN